MLNYRFALAAAALASTALVSTAAEAGDKPIIAPAPAWVKPVKPAAEQKAESGAVRLLLLDQQVALEPGSQTIYSEAAVKIQSPQGLAAGNISFPWSPDTSDLTVHKLLIRRGDKVIDVLASGQTFTVVRREANLESATLDGVLTANIQPEGLQVGDVLEFATSVTQRDPVLKGHVEQLAAGWNGIPVARAHLRVRWPSSLRLRMRGTASLPPLKPTREGGLNVVELALDDLAPVVAPKGAPPRYQLGRMVELSDFASWAEVGALLAPLYEKAAVLPAQGPLRSELESIRAASNDPKVRAEAALALVQDRIRYVALSMGAGGLVPADAETTWSRRYGDCKAKTALLLALLHALDIDAVPVAVNSTLGDGLDARLPMVGQFDHVLVRAAIGGKSYWLDGTRSGDSSLDRLTVPAFGWGLPLVAQGAALVRMVPPPLDVPTQAVTIRIDAREGITVPAPTKIEVVLRGDEAVATNLSLDSLSPDARERALREYWKAQYDFIDVTSTAAAFDRKSGALRLTMEGLAKMEWRNGWYLTDGTGVGYEADFSRDPGPDRDAPFAVPYPYFNRTDETILLPAGFAPQRTSGSDAQVDRTVAGIEYHRKASFADNVFTVEKTERSVVPEFPASEAPAAQAALRELANAAVYIRRPSGYQPTEKEVAAALAATPATADAFIERGNMLLNRERYDEAIADFGRAIALEPGNVWAYANRGISEVWKQNYAAAAKDLDAAAAIDARNAVVFRARGLMAEQQGAFKDAVAAYSKALEIEPDSSFALGHRAQAHRALGEDEEALADSAAALKRNPRWIELYLLRANVLRRQGQAEAAIAEAKAVAEANPGENYALVVAGNIYSAFHKDAEAMSAFDRALALKPEAYVYLNRSLARPKEDVAGRRADLDAALKLEPGFAAAVAAKAALQGEKGDYAGAAATYSQALAKAPDAPELLVQRGIAYARSGDSARAAKDFAAARAKTTRPVLLNNACWAKATAGVALQEALADCDAALAKEPDEPAFRDSRAFVLMRLGRLEEAIAEYDRVLAKNPRMTSSLFGRAAAWARKGDKAKSAADAEAALKIDPDVRTRFEGYGITL